jgi:hypothetical protein
MARLSTEALGPHLPAGLARLGTALLGDVHVHPAGEAVVEVPLALAVAQQDESGGHIQFIPNGFWRAAV